MEHIIKVNHHLISKFHEFDIGKGAKFDLRELRHNSIMTKFLCTEFEYNLYCLVGNIGELYRIRAEILCQERIGEMTYREYLETKMRKEL